MRWGRGEEMGKRRGEIGKMGRGGGRVLMLV